MKKMVKLFGVIAIVAVIGALTGCASLMPAPKWDSNMPKDQTATLVYSMGYTVMGVDGLVKATRVSAPAAPSGGALGMQQPFPGKGSEKKPKGILVIPAGEHTITARGSGQSANRSYTSPKFNFVAGRTYQMRYEDDQSFGDDNKNLADMGRGAMAALRDEVPKTWYFTDVTKKK
jgi:hypothetical protein